MKVFSRLNLTVKAAVKDIPADLREVINKHFRGGMKEFTKDVYRTTNKDLNDLEMSSDTFTKTSKIKEADINNITGARDKVLIINVFDNGKDMGIFDICGSYPHWFLDGRTPDVFELSKIEDPSKPWKVTYKNVGIYGKPRNIPVVLNWPGITYKAWIIDLSKAKDTKDLKNERYQAQKGIVERYKDAWGVDKSGYKVDRDKYVKMLKELKRAGNDYMDKIAKVSADYFEAVKEFQKKDPKAYPFVITEAAKAMQEAIDAAVDQYGWTDNKKVYEKINNFQKKVDEIKKRTASM